VFTTTSLPHIIGSPVYITQSASVIVEHGCAVTHGAGVGHGAGEVSGASHPHTVVLHSLLHLLQVISLYFNIILLAG
jgi:hypothetical protein